MENTKEVVPLKKRLQKIEIEITKAVIANDKSDDPVDLSDEFLYGKIRKHVDCNFIEVSAITCHMLGVSPDKLYFYSQARH